MGVNHNSEMFNNKKTITTTTKRSFCLNKIWGKISLHLLVSNLLWVVLHHLGFPLLPHLHCCKASIIEMSSLKIYMLSWLATNWKRKFKILVRICVNSMLISNLQQTQHWWHFKELLLLVTGHNIKIIVFHLGYF